MVVEYAKGTTILGQKVMVIQAKLGPGWKINSTQHRVLSQWPPFRFGRRQCRLCEFDLNPREREFGSYLPARRSDKGVRHAILLLSLADDWRMLVAATSSAVVLPTALAVLRTHACPPYPWLLVAITCDAPGVPLQSTLHPEDLRYGTAGLDAARERGMMAVTPVSG